MSTPIKYNAEPRIWPFTAEIRPVFETVGGRPFRGYRAVLVSYPSREDVFSGPPLISKDGIEKVLRRWFPGVEIVDTERKTKIKKIC